MAGKNLSGPDTIYDDVANEDPKVTAKLGRTKKKPVNERAKKISVHS